MAEIQESGNKKGGKNKQKKMTVRVYFTEQTSDDGDKHAEQ